MWIVGATAVTAHGLLPNSLVEIEGSKIVSVKPYQGERLEGEVVEAKGLFLTPGFIDMHIHGGGGADVMDATPEAVVTIAETHARHGTTALLATTMTQTKGAIRDALNGVRQAQGQKYRGAQLIGVHLEGPFLNLKYKGAQNPEHFRNPNVDELKELTDAYPGLVKQVTYAPELDKDGQFVRYLTQQGIIGSAGHTDATFEEIEAARAAGLCQITHCYNAQTALHHRKPGVVGAAMALKGLRAELIADGLHVHRGAMRALLNAKGVDEVVAITDSMRATGLEDGEYDLGGLPVFVKEGAARLADGTLAGSTLTMNRAVANLVGLVGLSLPEAVQLASLNPARALGLGQTHGSLCPGKQADLVLLDEHFEVQATYVAGQPIYRR